jgi:hypothetical protein
MRKILIAVILSLICFAPADAADLNLAWDANTESDLAGYRVYYGTASREYGDPIDVGNTTSFRLEGLLEGVVYYIATTAYDTAGNESGYSNEVSWTKNTPPTANAGPDQTVDKGVVVTLNGSNSTDPDDGIASYLWKQTGGSPAVTLTGADTAQASFTSPDVGSDGVALVFQLTVTDNHGLQDTDTCIVNVTWKNAPPKAEAGADQTVVEGRTLTLDGLGSSDPDGMIASYSWKQTGGTDVALSVSTAPTPTFVAPPVGGDGTTLTFELTVTDDGGLMGTDEISVTIEDNGITGFPDDVITSTSSTDKHFGIKVESGGSCVSLEPIDPATIADSTNRPGNLIYGLIEMHFKTNTLGGTVVVTFYLPTAAPDGYTWYKYSPVNGWYDYSPNATFNATRDLVTLTLIDADLGDDDGIANGMIVDPSGLGSAPSPSPGGGDGGGCFISTVAQKPK